MHFALTIAKFSISETLQFKATSFWQEEITIGTAEVRATFTSGSGRIAGCMVKEGKVEKGCGIRVVRDGRAVYVGTLDSLRRVKEIVKEVSPQNECGLWACPWFTLLHIRFFWKIHAYG